MNEKLVSKAMVVNAESHFWTVKEVLPDMMARNNGKGEGHIVSIASVLGLVGGPYVTDYAASKGASVLFMDSLRTEMKYLKKNILCTHICPWVINTGMFDGVNTSSLAYPMLDQNDVVNRIIHAIQ